MVDGFVWACRASLLLYDPEGFPIFHAIVVTIYLCFRFVGCKSLFGGRIFYAI